MRTRTWIKLSALLALTITAAVALGAACTEAGPTPTEPSDLTVTNVRVATSTPAPTATPGQYVADASRGAGVYSTTCAACHGPEGVGALGPALNASAFYQQHSTEDITGIIRSGVGVMPAFGSSQLSQEDVADLVAYLQTLGGAAVSNGTLPTPTPTAQPAPSGPTPAAQATTTPTQAPSEAVSGEDVFAKQCMACHGAAGAGGFGPALNTSDFQEEYSNEELHEIVRGGIGPMPGFSSSQINDSELEALVEYLISLR